MKAILIKKPSTVVIVDEKNRVRGIRTNEFAAIQMALRCGLKLVNLTSQVGQRIALQFRAAGNNNPQ